MKAMSYRHTLDAVLESMHEIEDLVKGFPETGKIPSVEIDLALQKIRNLYELLLMMKKPGEEASVPADEANISPPASVAEEKQPVAPVSQKAGKAQRSVSTIADQFKSQTTLHESYHQRYAGEGDTLSQASMVTSLQAAIGVNDRFTFIRELFMNNEAAYNNAVGILNDAPSFNDAYKYMAQQFDWDMDSEIVQQLLNIIRRKFIKGRHE